MPLEFGDIVINRIDRTTGQDPRGRSIALVIVEFTVRGDATARLTFTQREFTDSQLRTQRIVQRARELISIMEMSNVPEQ
jgi:hypothetical protein